MNCLAVREYLPELAIGVLPETERVAVERHLQWCAGCRKEATDLGQAAATFAFALAPASVPRGLADRVVTRIRRAAGAPGSRRRVRAAAASTIAAMVAVAGLGWGAVMAGKADRFAEQARVAEQQKSTALDQFRHVLANLGNLGTALPGNETHFGQLAPTSTGRRGGGAVLQLVSPTMLDFVIVIVNGLDPTDTSALPYRVTLANAAGEVLKAGRITGLDANGGAETFHQFQNRDLRGFTKVVVTDSAGEVVLQGTVDQSTGA